MKISVENLHFSYPGSSREILKGLSLQCETPGECCVLGVNGAGKSTLLKCMAGQEKPGSGRVLIDGRPIREFSVAEFARRVAYIPQSHNPTFPFSVLDVAVMGRAAYLPRFATPGPRDFEIAREKLEFLKIGYLEKKLYTEISGGERQLVMLAAALTQEPKLLLLDEPTAHLDFGNQHRFLMVLQRLVNEGMGVIMTSHFPDHALYLGGMTAVLKDGVFAFCGPSSEAITTERLTSLYGLPVTVVGIPGSSRRTCVPGEL
ncbi:ABC transporter ATP-binding protein [Mesosutterella sp. AGMB02718]|uniref:ABC transporter ATP-binding protein n=1 Tax=Mesosutterella faecium TaxID=2925194 RepID=A0ABT7IRU1_9BURK|nr:ABC transporter ATP-binding protein [Mesosutterella sp. AGMB02718]MDL2060021.1 ABC transporter ATP-binding protein [Mesosutterella sp. AGMB02718]